MLPHARHGIYSISGQLQPNTDVNKKFDIYHSARSVKQIAGFFEGQQNKGRDNDSTKASTQLEREVFQVLGDLDQKLAQEQSHNQTVRTSRLSGYNHGRQYGKEGSLHSTSEPKKMYSSLSSHNGRKTPSLEETHTTYATYQPRNFYEMYSNRQRSASKPEASKKNFHQKSPSLFSSVINTSSRSSPSFSSSSLHLSSPGVDLERTRPHKSKRMPVMSIKWNNAYNSGKPAETGRPFRAQSALDLTNLGRSSFHSRVFDLYKYKKTPKVPESTSDQGSSNNTNTNTSSVNNAGNRATGYYKTDSPDLGPEVKQTICYERYGDGEYKENSLNKNEMSKTVENLSSNDKETEPMEVESDLSEELNTSATDHLHDETEASSDLYNLSLQTKDFSTKTDVIIEECKMEVDHEHSDIQNKDIPIDFTFQDPTPLEVSSSYTSESEILDVSAQNVFPYSSKTSSSISVDHDASTQEECFTQQREKPDGNRSLDPIKLSSSYESRKSYKIDPPPYMGFKSSKVNDRENALTYKRSSLFNNTTDIRGRFAWMNRRRGSNDNHKGFQSDTLKFKTRNASSLPDLIDQDSDILDNHADVTFVNKSCENFLDFGATNDVCQTKSLKMSDDLENNLKSEKPGVQNTNQPKTLGSRIFQYLQRPYMSSYGRAKEGILKKLDQKTSYPTGSYLAERLTDKQSKYNHTKGFTSDTLKYKKRNSSSLPDLIDQDSDVFGNDPKTILQKNSWEHDGSYQTSAVPKTESSRIPEERKELYMDSSTRYGHSHVRDTIRQPRKSGLSTWQSLQKLPIFPYGSQLDRTLIETEKKTADSEVANQADTLTKNKIENFLNLETAPFSHVHTQPVNVKSVNRCQYNGQSGSDSNNNNNSRLVEGIPVYNKDDGSKVKSEYVHPKQDHPKTENVRVLNRDTFTKPNLTELYRRDVVSWSNQKSTDQVHQEGESERNLNQTLMYQLDQEANDKVNDYIEPPKVRDPKFPTSQTVKDVEQDNLSKIVYQPTTYNKSTKLLKDHLFVAPKPFTRNIPINVIHTSSPEDNQTPTYQEGEDFEDLASQEGLHLHETYTCEQVVKNTEIYGSLTDDSYTEVDKIEYRKVVSIYYSLPRKFSKTTSDLTKNNLKNADKTLAKNSAPSVLLHKISRRYKEEPDASRQSSEETLITETVHRDKVEDVPCKEHILDFNIVPLESNFMKNSSRTDSEEENDLASRFSTLLISDNEDNYTSKEEPMNKNSRPHPRYSSNTYYYTLPNKKSSLQDLERNVLERDIAMARDRVNIYTSSWNMEPSPPESQDVFVSPTFSYDNLNHSPGYDFMHFHENNKRDYNSNNSFARDGGLSKKSSLDEGLFLREDLPSIYKAKSFKDSNQPKSYNTEDVSPHMESNTSPQTDYNSSAFIKNNDLNRIRPSYCSEFVQKKMKPINAKKFSFSDHVSQERVNPRHASSHGDDADSPSVFYSPNENYPSHVNKYFGQESPKISRNDANSNLYRSKSMKLLNTEGRENIMDSNRKSDGSFSSKSCGGTLRGKSPYSVDTWNRRFSEELLDENDNWPEETCERKPVFTSKSLDYGIFGKEQQEAILNNVKRSLTEGRLWRPSFLKNPVALRTEEYCTSQELNPVGQAPDDGSSQGPHFKKPLNIYEGEPVVSSESDIETTTDDEYYLDGNDKESEL
ncbi:exophilin-5 isoform X2 [Dendropsophus ebraccatus]|uniref:exophilin-5 isoform X2 n=1 Tax=Dendropsophus ebraccatus TaxID=150705 RepID=UPI003831F36B